MMNTMRYFIYGMKSQYELLINCSFDNKQVAVDCLIHYINYIALKHGIKIWKDDAIKNILNSNEKYYVGNYYFWIEEEEI